MLIKRVSPFSGNVNEMEIPVTQEQYNDWQSGTVIQRAMPNLTPSQREFIITGITNEEWNNTFKEQEEE